MRSKVRLELEALRERLVARRFRTRVRLRPRRRVSINDVRPEQVVLLEPELALVALLESSLSSCLHLDSTGIRTLGVDLSLLVVHDLGVRSEMLPCPELHVAPVPIARVPLRVGRSRCVDVRSDVRFQVRVACKGRWARSALERTL